MSLHDLLSPSSPHGWAGLVADGMPPDAAFDEIARQAASNPDLQAVVARFASFPAGRQTLATLRRHWSEFGLPEPWDNRLELPGPAGNRVER